MELHQNKQLLHSKGNNQQDEKETYGMRKIYANHISNEEPICKIYKKIHTTL